MLSPNSCAPPLGAIASAPIYILIILLLFIIKYWTVPLSAHVYDLIML